MNLQVTDNPTNNNANFKRTTITNTTSGINKTNDRKIIWNNLANNQASFNTDTNPDPKISDSNQVNSSKIENRTYTSENLTNGITNDKEGKEGIKIVNNINATKTIANQYINKMYANLSSKFKDEIIKEEQLNKETEQKNKETELKNKTAENNNSNNINVENNDLKIINEQKKEPKTTQSEVDIKSANVIEKLNQNEKDFPNLDAERYL